MFGGIVRNRAVWLGEKSLIGHPVLRKSQDVLERQLIVKNTTQTILPICDKNLIVTAVLKIEPVRPPEMGLKASGQVDFGPSPSCRTTLLS